MRYLTNYNGPLDGDVIERAENLFDRFLGRTLALTTHKDSGRYDKSRNCFMLTNTPFVELVSINGRVKSWFYSEIIGATGLIYIPKEDVVIHRKDDKVAVSLPPSLYGPAYDEVEIEYKAGLTDIPQDINDAILEIAKLLDKGDINEWNCMLPETVIDVINKYQRKEEFR
jgi:hypothetical protein